MIETLREFYSRYENIRQMVTHSKHKEKDKIVADHLRIINSELHKFIAEQRKKLRPKQK